MKSDQLKITTKFIVVFPIITLTAVLQFCAPSVSTTVSSGYQEDISGYRIEYPQPTFEVADTQAEIPEPSGAVSIEPTGHIKAELDSVVKIIADSRKDIQFINGFSIQLYSGNSRDRASEARRKAIDTIEEFKPSMVYEQPNYKVRIGKYFSRLEANKDYTTIKSILPQAVLVPSKIRIE